MFQLGRWTLYIVGGLLVCVLLGATIILVAGYWTRYPGWEAPESSAIVVEGGVHFAPSRDTVREASRLVIQNDRIACVGDTCTAPKGARRIDASGLAVLPGLIDLHVHFDAPAGYTLNSSVPPLAMAWSYMRHRPHVRRAFVEHGVTTIRSVGDPVGHRFGMIQRKEALEEHELAGPRLVTAGPSFTAPDGHPVSTIYEGRDWVIRHATRQVTDPDTARTRVRRLADQGIDGIKIIYDEGAREQEFPRVDRNVLNAIVEAASQRDLWVAAHTSSREEVRHVLDAGVHTLEHGAYDDTLSSGTLKQMAAEDVTYVPTLSVIDNYVEQSNMPEAVLKQAMHNVRRAHNAGVPVGAGTDTQGPNMHFGRSLHRELALLVDAGLSPREALHAATLTAARAANREGLGQLAAGTSADLVIVDGRPWRDMRTLDAVKTVLRDGRTVVSERQNQR